VENVAELDNKLLKNEFLAQLYTVHNSFVDCTDFVLIDIILHIII